jgi:hypothetical protein
MLQYLVVLAGTDPLVWRRIRIPATYSFWDLHVAVQDAMGWLDCHLHQFRVLDPRSGTTVLIGIPDDEVPDDRSVVAGWREFPLDYMVGDAPPMHYLYDFGDDWQHALLFEGFEQGDRRRKKPQCIAGAGACPPEDSGGADYYAMLLAAVADSAHPEHEHALAVFGGLPDPSLFSVADVRFDDPKKRWHVAFDEGAS